MRMNSNDSVSPLITVCPRPSIIPAAGAVHCSVKLRMLTLPAQHPCSHVRSATEPGGVVTGAAVAGCAGASPVVDGIVACIVAGAGGAKGGPAPAGACAIACVNADSA